MLCDVRLLCVVPVLFCASDNKILELGLERNNQKAYCLGRFMAEAMPMKLVTVVPRMADNAFLYSEIRQCLAVCWLFCTLFIFFTLSCPQLSEGQNNGSIVASPSQTLIRTHTHKHSPPHTLWLQKTQYLQGTEQWVMSKHSLFEAILKSLRQNRRKNNPLIGMSTMKVEIHNNNNRQNQSSPKNGDE